MAETATVLVVDDDAAIGDLLRDFLEDEGFAVETARDGRAALAALERMPVDCLLLDVMLPGPSGFEICRQIRARYDVPIVFLSARDADLDKIRGLRLGGDDYVVKDATPEEVVARVQAVLRRYRPGAGAAHAADTLDFGRLVIDQRAREVRVDGRPVPVTAREYDLLHLLAENPRQVFTRDQLYERFWDGYGDPRTVTVHIGRLREKIELEPARAIL